MGLLSLFGGNSAQLKKALRNGAIVVDVRTGIEYDNGHFPDAFNIPVDRIRSSAGRLKEAKRPIIVVCNNGERSATAAAYLKESGVPQVYKGGSWEKLLRLQQSI